MEEGWLPRDKGVLPSEEGKDARQTNTTDTHSQGSGSKGNRHSKSRDSREVLWKRRS